MYQWFNHVTHVSDLQAEPKLVIEKDETLWCTPKGQVSELFSRTVLAFTRVKSQDLAARRPKLSPTELRRTVGNVLKLPGAAAAFP